MKISEKGKNIYRRVFYQLLKYPKLVYCNICKWSGRRFLDDNWLKRVSCPNCHSDIRHRLLLYSLTNYSMQTDGFVNKKILHFAPESFFQPIFSNYSNYVTADYAMKDVNINIDISDMNMISDSEFDIIIASDVLEHVYDDTKAIHEIYRILKIGGTAILTVPQKDNLKKTIEDLSALSPLERKNKLGQEDHYRIYGYDFFEKLVLENFDVKVFDAQCVSNRIRDKYVLFPLVLGDHSMVTNYRKIYYATKTK